MDDVSVAPTLPEREDNMPVVETTRGVVEHFNRDAQSMKAFDAAGYFIYQGVKVYEKGKRKTAE